MSVSSVAVPWLGRIAAVLTAGASVHSWSILCGNFYCMCRLFCWGK